LKRLTDPTLDLEQYLPGVYVLYALTSESGECVPVTIDRCCGQDPEGILYIGETEKGGRYKAFVEAFLGKPEKQCCGILAIPFCWSDFPSPSCRLTFFRS
jgi:hypothetical protein